MRRGTRWLCLALLALTSACAAVEPAEPEGEPPRRSDIEGLLFPSELLWRHRDALELDAAQDRAIREELERTRAELAGARRALDRDQAALAEVLGGDRVDEDAVLAAAARVTEREGAIKILRLRHLARIKNTLTPAQQRTLDQLRGP